MNTFSLSAENSLFLKYGQLLYKFYKNYMAGTKIYQSPAIIMRVREFGESDLIITFFTPEKGRIKGIAKGAKRSKARFVNCLDIFSLVNLEYSPGKKGDLYFIQSGRLVEAYPGLRTSYSRLTRASYMVELTEMLFPWELSDPAMFEILKRSFKALAENDDSNMTTELFEILAMSRGGYSINLDSCCICGRTYKGEGAAVFEPEKGGIACMRCKPVSALTPRMSPDTVRIFRGMQSNVFDMLETNNPSNECLTEIKPVLKLHREYRLEGNPRSISYLK